MRPRFTVAGMLWFSLLVGLLCAAGSLGYRLSHLNFPDQLAASADGRVLVVGGANDRLDVWDSDAGRTVQTIPVEGPHGVSDQPIVSRDGRRLTFRPLFGDQELWIREGEQFRRRPLPNAFSNKPLLAVSENCLWAVVRSAPPAEVDVFSLDDGTKLATCVGAVQTVSANIAVGVNRRTGRAFVAHDNGQLEVFNARSGKPVKTVATSQQSVVPAKVEISPDGRWAVLTALAAPSGEGRASIIDLEAGAEIRSEPIPSAYRAAAFAPDSRSVAIITRSGAMLYGLPGAEPLGTLGDADTWAVAAAGPDRWVLLSPRRLELFDPAAGTTTVLWRDRTLDEIVWVFLGLVVWLVVTAIVGFRRGRVACSVCGEVRLMARRKPQPICTVCYQQAKGRTGWRFLLVMLGLAMASTAGVAAIDWNSKPQPRGLSPFMPLIYVIAATLIYFGLFIAWFLWRLRRLRGERYDLRRAAKAAGSLGMVRRKGAVVAWSPGENECLEHSARWIAEAGEGFARLTGLEVDRQPAMRLLVFRQWKELDRYLKLYGINCWPLPGAYLAADKLAISLEGIRWSLSEPQRFITRIAGHFFCRQHKQLANAGWLDIGFLLAQNAWDDGLLTRRVRLLLAASPQAGSDVFDFGALLRILRRRLWYRTADYARLIGLLFERASMTSYLAGPAGDELRRGTFRALLGDLAAGTDWPQAIQRHYNATPEQLIEAWRQTVLAQAPGEHPTPEPWQLEIIVGELLPVAHDRRQPKIARLRAIRALGGCGFTTAGPDLVELATDPDPLVRADVLESLKMISGHDHGADLKAWRAWCEEERHTPRDPEGAESLATGNPSDSLPHDRGSLNRQ